jgi:hypothetical protein
MISAFAVALCCDLLQLPVNFLSLSGVLAIPGEGLDLILDGIAFVATTALLGFHWVLLPTAILEAVPFADALPSWTLCVAYVVSRRRQAERAAQAADPRALSRRSPV